MRPALRMRCSSSAYSFAVSVDVATAATRRVAAGIDDQVADGQLGREDVAASPGEGAKPGEELAEVEGLRQVVVGAGVESLDLVVDGVARGEHEDRRVDALAPNLATDFEAVADGEDDVEDDGIVVVDGREEDGPAAVGGVVYGVRGFAQSAGDRFAELTVVLGQQNPHGSRSLRLGRKAWISNQYTTQPDCSLNGLCHPERRKQLLRMTRESAEVTVHPRRTKLQRTP